mmetsp:Transcript_5754/g.8824  ORF Transcript_5754/g.8824 Transcript_5754/m.8824 type:complete len:232 (-) Transcript_5754:813-1508(-)
MSSSYRKSIQADAENHFRTKGMKGTTASSRFYNRFPNDPQNRSELRRQERVAASLKKEHALGRDVCRYDKNARQAADTAGMFRKLERQADDNWRFLPTSLVSKHKKGDGTYNVSALKSEIHNRRHLAESHCQEFEKLSRDARNEREHYEASDRYKSNRQKKWSAIGAGVGEVVSIGAASSDFGLLAAGSGAVAGGLAKYSNNRKSQAEAYEEMNAARQYYRSQGYQPGDNS